MTISVDSTGSRVQGRALLADLQKLLKSLEKDLIERSDEAPQVRDTLRRQYNQARQAERTSDSWESWRTGYITQVAAAWILGCVFVRHMEDNGLIDEVWLAGEKDRMRQAHDAHEIYFRRYPTESDREYLKHVFREVAKSPAVEELLGEGHNPLWRLDISGDAARQLLLFWQAADPATGALVRSFEAPDGDTRYLGDLYQDLSEDARKRFALLQTPAFVESFILDRTLEPAIAEFGLDGVRIIDPTCGSGHFLLGAFSRIFAHWKQRMPSADPHDLARRALDAVHGVDLNPFAVAVARFRLLTAALRACNLQRLSDAPDFTIHLACGDSLLHGRRFNASEQLGPEWRPEGYAEGDYDEASRILSMQYHAVVGNPPYITDKDEAHREAVRTRYKSCYRQFSLGVPFTERFFELAHQPSKDTGPG